jgi:hypothetical protein
MLYTFPNVHWHSRGESHQFYSILWTDLSVVDIFVGQIIDPAVGEERRFVELLSNADGLSSQKSDKSMARREENGDTSH